jgi:putative hydrolase of the HAD superfamily
MEISPLAGKPADLASLVDVPKLVTAYYTEIPDPAVPGQRVSFGTSGHRGSAFERAFNEWHILAISQAICLYRAQKQIDGPLFLGLDTHALSVPALASALEVLAANGVVVLFTDGWDHHARKRAATEFNLDLAETQDRHHLVFETYEEGKTTLEEYLAQVVFYQERPFTPAQFRKFLFTQSKPYPKMIKLVRQLKVQYGLKVVVVSNEARELNLHRIRKFKLDKYVDSFISSSFVHVRKPDPDIFRLALDIAQTPARQIVYIEDTPMFVQIAEGLGIRSIHHTDYKSTRAELSALGLEMIE